MNNSKQLQKKLTELLNEIEAELRNLELWSPNPPTAEALASQLPFCCDTMPFEGWLQYIFLPRIRALLEGNLPLPQNCEILPMASEAFKRLSQAATPLLLRLAEVDRTLTNAELSDQRE